MAKITILSLEAWLDSQDKSLFDNLTLPDGYIKNDITDNIMMRAGEMEVLYPDPEFFTAAIGLWGKKHYRTFDKWLNALNIEYNPLENYDRQETYTDNGSGTDSTTYGAKLGTDTIGAQHSSNTIGQQLTTNSMGEITNTDVMAQQHTVNENTVSAYDASTYQPNEKNDATVDAHTDSHTQGAHTDTSTAGSRTDTSDADARTDNHTEAEHTDDTTRTNTLTHTARVHGNIGVTTSQQMLQSELDIALWNLYEHIADLFMTEFCIMVY